MRQSATAPRIVLVAPDPVTQRRVQMALGEHGYLVAAAAHPGDAHRLLELDNAAALVVDARGPEHVTFALDHAQGVVPLIGLIDPHDVDGARKLLVGGVRDVVPATLIESLLIHRLKAVTGDGAGERTGAAWGRRKADLLVGHSPAIVAVKQRIDMIAKSDMGAAIFGETGTGKELVARTIHSQSRRAGKPLVVANCTALPEALFENELFGHERGAFTGADSKNLGLLSEAEGGSLLLDEIGDLTDAVQAKLLRLLQFREYKLIGGTKTLKADVRILTSTHRDLARASADGRFRQDLYYRMNTLHVMLPPLRDRLEDIPLLVDHFVTLFNEREQRDCEGFTPAAIRLMQRHDWPGNVRELESVVYRSLVMSAGKRRLDDGDVDVQRVARSDAPHKPLDLSRPFADLKAEVIERFERRYLEALLVQTAGNLSKASRHAQHERKSLWRLLSKYDIDPRRFRSSAK